MKILVADDDPSTRQLLLSLLGKWGYGVLPTSNGEEAWQVLEHDTTVRVALIDWFMPGITGLELIKRIRDRSIAPFHAILITSRGGKQSMLEAIDAGADDFVSKPFDKEILQARLKVAVRLVELQSYLIGRLTEAETATRSLSLLRPFVPTCGICGKVRDQGERWHKLDLPALAEKNQTAFQICCPDCSSRIAKVTGR